MMSEPEILPLNAQAALGDVGEPERSQFSHLFRHFLERFFNHETASPDGDAKARLVLIAFATGLPGFVIALYLWPVYHPFFDDAQTRRSISLTVADHLTGCRSITTCFMCCTRSWLWASSLSLNRDPSLPRPARSFCSTFAPHPRVEGLSC